MKHKISINKEDIVELKYVGEISDEDNIEMIKRSYTLINELLDRGKKPLVLVDLTQTSHFTPPDINVQAMRDSEAFKLAGFGISNPDDYKIAEQIIEKSGSNAQIRIFQTREQAIAWLQS